MGFSYPANAGWRLWALAQAGRADVIVKISANAGPNGLGAAKTIPCRRIGRLPLTVGAMEPLRRRAALHRLPWPAGAEAFGAGISSVTSCGRSCRPGRSRPHCLHRARPAECAGRKVRAAIARSLCAYRRAARANCSSREKRRSSCRLLLARYLRGIVASACRRAKLSRFTSSRSDMAFPTSYGLTCATCSRCEPPYHPLSRLRHPLPPWGERERERGPVQVHWKGTSRWRQFQGSPCLHRQTSVGCHSSPLAHEARCR